MISALLPASAGPGRSIPRYHRYYSPGSLRGLANVSSCSPKQSDMLKGLGQWTGNSGRACCATSGSPNFRFSGRHRTSGPTTRLLGWLNAELDLHRRRTRFAVPRMYFLLSRGTTQCLQPLTPATAPTMANSGQLLSVITGNGQVQPSPAGDLSVLSFGQRVAPLTRIAAWHPKNPYCMH